MDAVTGVASSTYNAASRILSAGPSNQKLNRQPAICSLRLARPTGRIAMPSSSPQSSSSQPSTRTKKSPKVICDTDANIHNFAPVARIMKTALPENAKIAKEAKECMQECVSEFISFITSEGTYSTSQRSCSPAAVVCRKQLTSETASEKCQQEKRKTVNGEDILFAMTSLGFENYGEALKIYLARYREVSHHIRVHLILFAMHSYHKIHTDCRRTWLLVESTRSQRLQAAAALPRPRHLTRMRITTSSAIQWIRLAKAPRTLDTQSDILAARDTSCCTCTIVFFHVLTWATVLVLLWEYRPEKGVADATS